ncbi:MAG: hypothetical protein A2Y12_05445 [Planctomycetes bacterium GWF2_42_9]|nr:MAG: hypothetical protein A2Y12_05445 [Planctomycetes bacterium GWF2_42_9]
MSSFNNLFDLKRRNGFVYQDSIARIVFAPDLGARVFCEINGVLLHRIDIENVRMPIRSFNNYGGNNFWPAPEGGQFGFNYDSNTWYVQPAINNEPFFLESQNQNSARAIKETVLVNRNGIKIHTVLRRDFTIAPLSKIIEELQPIAAFSYTVDDSIAIKNNIRIEEALLACWSLEQFVASDSTMSFAKVDNPQGSINFDFYDDPRNKIEYGENGFFYKTDSKQRGQIGIKNDSSAAFIGFYDRNRGLLCIREVVGQTEGLYFNIADNAQPKGPFSAEDNYSIFNGDEGLGFFELETIGGAQVLDGYLKGSRLISKTSFALFDNVKPLEHFIRNIKLGSGVANRSKVAINS